MSNKDKQEIEIIGFKNSKYVGQAKKNQKGVRMPEGFGAIVDDLFLTCVGNWK